MIHAVLIHLRSKPAHKSEDEKYEKKRR